MIEYTTIFYKNQVIRYFCKIIYRKKIMSLSYQNILETLPPGFRDYIRK